MSEQTCSWDHDGDGDTWATSCHEYFMLIDEETPTECGFKFCPFCGKTLEVPTDGETTQDLHVSNLREGVHEA